MKPIQLISFSPFSHYNVFRERCSAISLHLLRWTQRRRCGGSPAAPPHLNIFRNFFAWLCSFESPLYDSGTNFLKQGLNSNRSTFEFYVLGFWKSFLIFLESNPNLTYFLCWWRIWTLIWKTNGEPSWFYILGFRFKLFLNLFEVFTSIHRLFSILSLRWWFKTKNEKVLYAYLIWFGDSNKRSTQASGKSWTENKSVVLFSFFFTGVILLQSSSSHSFLLLWSFEFVV